MLTWFPPVNEIKVQTWRRETVQTSSDGGALIKTARKFLVFFFFVNTELFLNVLVRRSLEGQTCNVRGENTGPDRTGPSLHNNRAGRESGLR